MVVPMVFSFILWRIYASETACRIRKKCRTGLDSVHCQLIVWLRLSHVSDRLCSALIKGYEGTLFKKKKFTVTLNLLQSTFKKYYCLFQCVTSVMSWIKSAIPHHVTRPPNSNSSTPRSSQCSNKGIVQTVSPGKSCIFKGCNC